MKEEVLTSPPGFAGRTLNENRPSESHGGDGDLWLSLGPFSFNLWPPKAAARSGPGILFVMHSSSLQVFTFDLS